MNLIIVGAVLMIALQHLAIMVLEMCFWTSSVARSLSGMDLETAQKSASLAANQGLYNGFLAAGLIWSLMTDQDLALFFLACIVIAGVFGGITVSKKIAMIQALPALLVSLLIVGG